MQDRATEEEHRKVPQDCTVAGVEVGGVFSSVDIGRDDAIEVTPANHDTKRHTSLVDSCPICQCIVIWPWNNVKNFTLDIVARPSDRVGDRRIDSGCAEESSCVPSARSLCSQQHRETDSTNRRHNDVANASSPSSVGNPADKDGENGSQGIGGHTQQLRLGRRITLVTL